MAATPTVSSLDQTLKNSPFWPDVSPRAVVEAVNIAATGRDGPIVARVLEAMAKTNEALRAARIAAQADGFASLEAWALAQPDAEDDALNGQPAALLFYHQAVAAWTKARVIAMQATSSRTPNRAEAEAAAAENTVGWWETRFAEAVGALSRRLAPQLQATSDFGVRVALI